MRFLFPKLLWVYVLLVCVAVLARADRVVETEKPSFPATQGSFLLKSGYAFSGTVTAIKYVKPTRQGAVGVMQITFHVDSAVRGVRDGQSLTISEWPGLWQMGERYRPGEHVFLFLYPPSKLGLTSPVQGGLGRFSVAKGGGVTVHPDQRNILPHGVRKKFDANGEIHIRDLTRALRDSLEAQE